MRVVLLLALAVALVSGGRKRKAASHADNTIEDVDAEYIEDILDDGKHVLILYYEAASRCRECGEALRELEEIDDELENADIAVVKTDDDSVAEDLGIETAPALVYFRRQNPILYDGAFTDSRDILKWVLAHDEVATEELDDSDFEDRTQASDPPDSALPWLVMFHDGQDSECSQYVAALEAVAHKVRGMVRVGRVDVAEADDVAARFRVDPDEDCPTFLLLDKAKLYRYKDTAMDVRSFTHFALHKYKEQRGHKVPEPPFFVFEFFEELKEDIADAIEDHLYVVLGLGGVFVAGGIGFVARRIIAKRRLAQEDKDE